ncbi:MAG TPA: aminotransferase class III-fold pyridoxal phosphate-dependent enzyme, partial [Kofleriaceae bacterium]|nr:aminotransferase class III-fold pyridoxal phosphate-dependent enzyme [Kofleriaceae bacterium]
HRDVAAFLIEPVIMSLGIELPSPDFLRGAAELCAHYGTLFVADEVASGFGRTGAMFACEHAGIEPDILMVAGAITSGHAPLGAAITTAEIADAIRDEFRFHSTFAWHPLAVEAALATVEVFERHHAELFANVAERSRQIASRLATMPWPGARSHPGELRAIGLAIAVRAGVHAAQIARRCRAGGLLLLHDKERLVMFPALTVDEATVESALDILAGALAA